MRELDRIERILTLVEKIWIKNQDLRFFQLTSIIESLYSKANENTFIDESGNVDLFYLEDDKLEEFLINYIDEYKGE